MLKPFVRVSPGFIGGLGGKSTHIEMKYSMLQKKINVWFKQNDVATHRTTEKNHLNGLTFRCKFSIYTMAAVNHDRLLTTLFEALPVFVNIKTYHEAGESFKQHIDSVKFLCNGYLAEIILNLAHNFSSSTWQFHNDGKKKNANGTEQIRNTKLCSNLFS